MINLPDSQKPIIMNSYPHMLIEDTETWTQFLRSGKVAINEVWYDLHVGIGMTFKADEPEYVHKLGSSTYKKRIDVIARVDSEYFVVEIKPFGNMVALGQALSYHRMFSNEYKVSGKITPCICCLKVDNDIIDDCKQHGIVLWIP